MPCQMEQVLNHKNKRFWRESGVKQKTTYKMIRKWLILLLPLLDLNQRPSD